MIGFRSDTSELYSQVPGGSGGLLKSVGFGNVFTFDITYDPNGGSGNGSITYIIDGAPPEEGDQTRNLGGGAKAALGSLVRFGILSRGADGDNQQEAYLDGLMYTSAIEVIEEIPEPASLLFMVLGGLGLLMLIVRRRQVGAR